MPGSLHLVDAGGGLWFVRFLSHSSLQRDLFSCPGRTPASFRHIKTSTPSVVYTVCLKGWSKTPRLCYTTVTQCRHPEGEERRIFDDHSSSSSSTSSFIIIIIRREEVLVLRIIIILLLIKYFNFLIKKNYYYYYSSGKMRGYPRTL